MIKWFLNKFKSKPSFEEELAKSIVPHIHWYDDKKNVFIYARIIMKQYMWQLKNMADPSRNNNTWQIPDLLEEISKLGDRIDYYSKDSTEQRSKFDAELDAHKDSIEYLKKEVSRFEHEVIHLKELVEEKNMVVDKLLAERQNDKADQKTNTKRP